MTSITDYYGITGPVPFVNIAVDADTRLYLDPHAVRRAKGSGPFAAEAVRCLDTFFAQVTAAVISSSPRARRDGERLLQHFAEPWETRLGMSAVGFFGHGGAGTVGSWIWDVLNNNVHALVEVGVLRRLEHLPLFVNGVGNDITSDIATRILFGPLAQFTASVVATMPEFTSGRHGTRTTIQQVWDPLLSAWGYQRLTLPVANGRPLLLIPDGWARSVLLMNATRYYETQVLSFAQFEQRVVDARGKVLLTPKDRLKRQENLARGRATNLTVTLRAFRDDQDLLAAFESFIAEQIAKAERKRRIA